MTTDLAKPTYRLTYCQRCGRDTWHRWYPGHRWVCECGNVRQENVWRR